MSTFTITKIKTFIGREGHGLNATICKDGKPICFVSDDASGGEVDFDFSNPLQNGASFKATTKEMAATAERELGEYCISILSAAERKHIEDNIIATKAYCPNLKEDMVRARDSIEHWVNATIDDLQNKKRFDKHAKTKTLFRLRGDKAGNWRTLGAPYSPAIQAQLDRTHGEKVVAIWGVKEEVQA